MTREQFIYDFGKSFSKKAAEEYVQKFPKDDYDYNDFVSAYRMTEKPDHTYGLRGCNNGYTSKKYTVYNSHGGGSK